MANWWDQIPQASPLDAALAAEGITGPLAQLAQSVYMQESTGGRNTQTSNAGAVGGMQILPGTFAEVADEGWDINDPVHNARAGLRYLQRMQELGGGDPRMAAVGYYGGPGAIRAAQQGQARSDPRNPNAPDTLQYADQVLARVNPQETQPSEANWWESMPIAEVDQAQQQMPSGQPAQQRGFGAELGRQLGLTARAGIEGLAAFPEMLVNPISRAVGGPEMRVSNTLDALGFPQPETSTERIAQDVAGAIAGTGGVVGLAGKAARGLTGTAQRVTRQLGSAVPQQIAGAAGAGGAGGLTREAGYGPEAQTAAALAGGLLASSATNRAITPPRQKGATDPTRDLRRRASALYEDVNRQGITASRQQTAQLQNDMRNLLANEGLITPTGKVVSGYPKINGALRMIKEYAGQPMTAKQMQSVRRLLSNAAGSPDKTESRLGTLMVRAFDDFTAPLAPELAEARSLYSAAMRGKQLETLRDVAESRAKQFSQSGIENALRSEYRTLYNRILRGQERGFSPEQVEAIRRVAEGTTAANVARQIGKLAPTGVVSAGFSGGVPFMIGNALGGPALGGAASLGTMGLGALSRNAATAMTSRNAAIAEALARNMPLTAQATPALTNPMGALYGAALMNQQR